MLELSRAWTSAKLIERKGGGEEEQERGDFQSGRRLKLGAGILQAGGCPRAERFVVASITETVVVVNTPPRSKEYRHSSPTTTPWQIEEEKRKGVEMKIFIHFMLLAEQRRAMQPQALKS